MMDTKQYFKNIFLWIVPAILLLLTLLPIPLPLLYGLLLEIVVSLAALYITYLLCTEKPKYYVVWAIIFILIFFIYNPIVKIPLIVNIALPLNLITALLFLANWFFVFRNKN